MDRKKQAIDVINILLEECILAYPVSSFVISLYKQYGERGSLSKKQLQGLHAKASKIIGLPPGKLAAVEAIIKRMPTRNKTAVPPPTPLYEKDEQTGQLIEAILARFPAHKAVLLLKSRYLNNEILSIAELQDLKRLKLALDKKSIGK